MTTTTRSADQDQNRRQKVIYRGAATAPVYGLGLIGAWIYYLTHATTFWMGALGILKGIFWPAILVYELMQYLHL